MAVQMTSQEALNGIYSMLASIMDLQTTGKNESAQPTSATDLTITSLLKGIIETNSADKLKSTGEALESLAKGVSAFDDTTRSILEEVNIGLLVLNNTLSLLANNTNMTTSIDNLLELFNKFGKIDAADAANFTLFILNLTLNKPEDVLKNLKALNGVILLLDQIMSLDIKKLIKNLKALEKHDKLGESIGNFIILLNKAVNDASILKLSKETALAIGELLSGIAKFATTSIWKILKTFNPVTAWIIGKALSVFLKALNKSISDNMDPKQLTGIAQVLGSIAALALNSINNSLKVLSLRNALRIAIFFKVLSKKLPDKELADRTKSVAEVLNALGSFDKEKIEAIRLLGKTLRKRYAKRISKFITELCKGDVDPKQIEAVTKTIQSLTGLVYSVMVTFTAIVLMVALFPMTTVLMGYFMMKSLIKFSIKTVNRLLTAFKDKDDAKSATNIMKSISILFMTMTLTLVVLVVVSKFASLRDILGGVILFTAVVTAGILIMNKLNPKNSKLSAKQIKNLISSVHAISLLFLAISTCMLILTLTVKSASADEIWAGIGILITFMTAGYLLVFGLTRISKKKLKQSYRILEVITAMFVIISLISSLIMPTISKLAGDVLIGTSIVLLIIAFMVGAVVLLSLIPKKKLKASTHTLVAMTLIFTLISLVSLLLIIPISKQGTEVLAGVAIVLGIIIAISVIVFVLSILNRIVRKGILALAAITIIVTAISLVITALIIPIGNQADEAWEGTKLVVGILGGFMIAIGILAAIPPARLTQGVTAAAAITIIILVLSLVIKEILIPIGNNAKAALYGEVLLAAVVMGFIGLVYVLSSRKLTEKLPKSFLNLLLLAGVVALLAIAVGILTLVAREAGREAMNTLEGLGLIALMIGGVAVIVKLLSKFERSTLAKGGLILAGLSGLLLVLGLCLGPIIDVAIKAGSADGVLEGLGVVAAILGATLVVIAAVGALSSNPVVATVLAVGAAVLVGVSGVLITVAKMVNVLVNMVKHMQSLNKDEINNCGEKLKLLFKVAYNIVAAATPNLKQTALLAAAMTALPFLALLIVEIRGVAALISNIIKNVSLDDIVKFKEIVIGKDYTPGKTLDSNTLLGSLYQIVEAFNQFSFGGTAGAAIIAAVVKPIIDTVSKFIDVVKKVALMQYISSYDDNGNPVFSKLEPSVFGDAATNVSEGFGKFLTMLKDGFADAKILSLLLVPLIATTMNPIIDTVSKFVDVVIKVAALQYVKEYDDNGNPVFELIPPSTFAKAATTISDKFFEFIDTLQKKFETLKELAQGGIHIIGMCLSPVVDTISKFVDVVIKVATLLIVKGYDENGNPEFEKVEPKIFNEAAVAVSTSFQAFITDLSNNMENIQKVYMPSCLYSLTHTIGPVMEHIGSFADAIVKLASAQVPDEWNEDGTPKHFRTLTEDEMTAAGNAIATSFGTFLDSITANFKSSWFGKNTEDALEAMSGTMGPVMQAVANWTDSIYKLAAGVIEFDEKDPKTGEYVTRRLKLEDKDYILAATRITTSFSTFITTITNLMTTDLVLKAETAKTAIQDSINPIMDAVVKFSKALEPFLNMQDKDAKSAEGKYLAANPDFVKTIADQIAQSLVSFISIITTAFSDPLNQANYKSIAEITPAIQQTLEHIDKASSKLRNIIKSLTNDNQEAITVGETVALNFIKALNAFMELGKTPDEYATAKLIYQDSINPMLEHVKKGTEYITPIVNLMNTEGVNIKDLINSYNDVLDSVVSKTVSIFDRIKDINIASINMLFNAYQIIAFKLAKISHFMLDNNDLVYGIDIFLASIDKLTSKDVNAHIVATGGNIKIYVERLVSFTNQIKDTTKHVEIYITTLDRAREALLSLDKQIIDNARARDEALLNFADKVNNIAQAVTNLKSSFDALNEQQILAEFENIRSILKAVNQEIENPGSTSQMDGEGTDIATNSQFTPIRQNSVRTGANSQFTPIRQNSVRTGANTNTPLNTTPTPRQNHADNRHNNDSIFNRNLKVEFIINGNITRGTMAFVTG